MVRTYTLYLRDGGDQTRFEPALCRDDVEALARARELLALHPECESVEAYFGDAHLFTVTAKPVS